jgi:hypothetical protein
MTTLMKYAVAAALTGAMTLAAASPSEARKGRNAAAAIGFGDYAYEPVPVYRGRAASYYGWGYRSNLRGCLSSPASPRFGEEC